MRKTLLLALVLLPSLALATERDAKQVRLFRKDNPCPATGKTTGPCPGYNVDHIMPLCWGGADAPHNMMWLTRANWKKKFFFEIEACRLKKKQASCVGPVEPQKTL